MPTRNLVSNMHKRSFLVTMQIPLSRKIMTPFVSRRWIYHIFEMNMPLNHSISTRSIGVPSCSFNIGTSRRQRLNCWNQMRSYWLPSIRMVSPHSELCCSSTSIQAVLFSSPTTKAARRGISRKTRVSRSFFSGCLCRGKSKSAESPRRSALRNRSSTSSRVHEVVNLEHGFPNKARLCHHDRSWKPRCSK